VAVLNINLGLKSYEICDTDGNTVGVIRFNPSDPGMVSRWKEVQEFINGFDEKEYNTPEKIGEADRAIKEKFNYAFGTDVSSVLFQNVSSLALCEDGRMVLENVLEAVQPIIEEAMKVAQKNSEARVRARTAEYEGSKKGLAPRQR